LYFEFLYSGVCNRSFVLVHCERHSHGHPSCVGHATPCRSDMLHCPELKRTSCYSNPLTFPISRKSSSCKLHPYFKKCVGVSVLVNCTPSLAPLSESPSVVHFLEACPPLSLCSKRLSHNERINQQKSTSCLVLKRSLVAFFASRNRLLHLCFIDGRVLLDTSLVLN